MRTYTTAFCAHCGGEYQRRTDARTQRFCSTRCTAQWRWHSNPPDLASLFWPRVSRDGPTPPHCPDLGPCWIWNAGTLRSGYGQIMIAQRTYSSHRLAWTVQRGPIPAGMFVLHRCDNRLCVNPDHLFLGTQADNMADMARKGRHYSKTRPGAVPRGSEKPLAKLDEAKVREIRALRANGLKLKAIGTLFGVTLDTIGKVCAGKSWRHVT